MPSQFNVLVFSGALRRSTLSVVNDKAKSSSKIRVGSRGDIGQCAAPTTGACPVGAGGGPGATCAAWNRLACACTALSATFLLSLSLYSGFLPRSCVSACALVSSFRSRKPDFSTWRGGLGTPAPRAKSRVGIPFLGFSGPAATILPPNGVVWKWDFNPGLSRVISALDWLACLRAGPPPPIDDSKEQGYKSLTKFCFV